MVSNLKTNFNRLKKLFLLVSIIIAIYFILIKRVSLRECVFHRLFNISCPACGLTRAFYSIIDLKFVDAFKFNMLWTIVFIMGIKFGYFLVKDILRNEYSIEQFMEQLGKHYKLIVLILVIMLIINNINPLV